MNDQPVGVRLDTPRLVLRMYAPRDHEALHRMVSKPEMFRFSHRGAMRSEEAWSLLLRHIGHWASFGYGVFAVEETETGTLLGEAGLSDFRRRLGPDFDPHPEITWSILPEAQGRGYAAEAAAAALHWAETARGLRRTVCLIHEENAPSLRVAARLGYRPMRRLTYRGYPALLMERERETS